MEGIAVIGMAARFPGARDLEAFWENLSTGVECIRRFSESELLAAGLDEQLLREPSYIRAIAALDEIDGFDAGFFGIRDREAEIMDPQLRLLLETSWEAMENAGVRPDGCGAPTGVYLGANLSTYLLFNLHSRLDRSGADFNLAKLVVNDKDYFATRIAYQLDLKGPAVTVQTACSTSLVAVHLASQALLGYECDMALAGGVGVRVPHHVGYLNQGGTMLSADGHCRPFDARANGTVPGSGVGVVVLKRLDEAVADGDFIHAVLRGSALTNDGADKIGFTAPSVEGQESAVAAAQAAAGVEARTITYVEAHGTATPLGDPIEIEALTRAFRRQTDDCGFCAIGSVKSNFGHLESAAGIAGLIKTILALRYRSLPPSLHFDSPNPLIDFASSPFFVNTSSRAWEPAPGAPRRAGVSSFGFGGTNCHVVLEEAPEILAPQIPRERCAHLLTLSAASSAALATLAERHRRHLERDTELPAGDVAFTANVGRAPLRHRLAVVSGSSADLARGCAPQAASSPVAVWSRSGVADEAPAVAFLFTGQGAQCTGAGHGLYQSQPVFRQALEHCDELLREPLGESLLAVLYPEPGHDGGRIHQTAFAQPALFALGYALCELWRSWGIEASAVLGHSVGEYTAACVAGALSLEDGLRLIAGRGRLMQELPAGGAMAAVSASPEQVGDVISDLRGALSIAAVNGPRSLVLSGRREALEEALERLARDGARSEWLKVSHAFHSPLVEPMLDEFEELASTVELHPPRKRLISNLTGRAFGSGERPDAAYWRRHARQQVRFADGIRTLAEAGCQVFVELGPRPALLAMARRCLGEDHGSWLPSLRPGRDDWQQILESLGSLWVAGAPVDWRGLERGYPRRRVPLPTYPFEHRRYWLEGKSPIGDAAGRVETLPGRRTQSARSAEIFFETSLDPESSPSLRDHRVHDRPVAPGATLAAMALAAARELFCGEAVGVENVVFSRPLVLAQARRVQLVVSPEGGGRRRFDVFSRAEDAGEGEEWTLHGSGEIVRGKSEAGVEAPPASVCAHLEERPVAGHYRIAGELGLELGPSFHELTRLWYGENELCGEIRAPQGEGIPIDPSTLDACFQVLGAAATRGGSAAGLPVLFEIRQIHLHGPIRGQIWCHARISQDAVDASSLSGDLRVFDEIGRTLAVVGDLALKRTTRQDLYGDDGLDELLYEVVWRPAERSVPAFSHSPSLIAERVEPEGGRLSREHGLSGFQDLASRIESWSAEYVVRALRELGLSFDPGLRLPAAELGERLGVRGRHRRLLERLLGILGDEGLFERSNGEWRLVRPPPAAVPETTAARLAKEYPGFRHELSLVRRCGERLAEVLTGTTDPLELLFTAEAADSVERLYRESPQFRVFNSLLGKTFSAALEAVPADRPLRILEIGAGTGSATASILPTLAAEHTEYFFTDISPLLVSRARDELGDKYPFVRFEVLDIERDPAAQGFPVHHYDAVLASNVLHATRELRATRRHVRRLLAPGGLLMLLEGTGPRRWLDLTFGLLDGWWRFEDRDLRASYPLLPPGAWQRLLTAEGFAETAHVPTSGHPSLEACRLAVIVARATSNGRPVAAESRRWLLFADAGGVAEALAARLRALGDECSLIAPGDVDPDHPEGFGKLLPHSYPLHGVIHLWSLDGGPPQAGSAEVILREQKRNTASALYLIQALAAPEVTTSPRLWLVTRGAQPVAGGAPGFAQAPLWGLSRAVGLEHPEMGCTCIDLDPGAPLAEAAEQLWRELEEKEPEVAFRAGRRYLARLAPAAQNGRFAEPLDVPEDGFRLEPDPSGVLDQLRLRPWSPAAPGPGEVAIRVRNSALNFKDVLNALGMIPGHVGPLGGECSGDILALGKGVSGFEVGQSVVTVARGSLASHVISPAALVAPRPANLSDEQAASLPVAFITAHYALDLLGGMKAGDRVLIHAASGGVGLAAVQLARRVGAEVFATAGNAEKRRFLRALGVELVMGSRSPAFAEEVRRHTGGRGVDLVLNSLSGELITASLDLLAPGGRFLELGQIGIWDEARVAEAYPHVTYRALAIDRLVRERPQQVGDMLRRMMEEFAGRRLEPLPLRTFAMEEAVAAFRFMQQARHVGKIVLRPPTALPVRPNATYLITGGLGGLGLKLAGWLAERGARHLVLSARHDPSPQARELRQELEAAGVEVRMAGCDVTRYEELERLVNEVRNEMPPLGGVIHAVGVLDDGLLANQTWRSFETVMAPKIAGALNLHRLTRQGRPLDFLVFFSSAAALLGASGQSNHSAANAFLDAFAHDLRAHGVNALSINWGPWAEIGSAAQPEVRARLASHGYRTLAPHRGLVMLERLLESERAQVGVMAMDWPAYLSQLPEDSALLRDIAASLQRRPEAAAVAAHEPSELRLLVDDRPPGERLMVLRERLTELVSGVLGVTPAQIAPRGELASLGLDSLMAVEVRNLINSAMARRLPATLLFDHPSVDALARYLATEVLSLELAPERVVDEPAAEVEAEWTEELDAVSGEQLRAMLDAELGDWDEGKV